MTQKKTTKPQPTPAEQRAFVALVAKIVRRAAEHRTETKKAS